MAEAETTSARGSTLTCRLFEISCIYHTSFLPGPSSAGPFLVRVGLLVGIFHIKPDRYKL